jgi:Rrf2 family protein
VGDLRPTRRSTYALRGLVELTLAGRGERLTVCEVARRAEIPQRFLEQIFCELRRASVLKSNRGPGGGYSLAVPPEEITVLDVVGVLEGRPHVTVGRCWSSDAASMVWEEAEAALAETLSRYSIAWLAAEEGARRRSRGALATRAEQRRTSPREAQGAARTSSGGSDLANTGGIGAGYVEVGRTRISAGGIYTTSRVTE